MIMRTCSGTLLLLAVATAARADINISNKPTQNMNCSAGVCTPTAPDAVLNVGDLTAMLASGDLTVQTGNGDNTTAGITVSDDFSWTNSSRLTLTAKNNIRVKAPVTVAGHGALTITYAAGNPGGDLSFEKKGKIDFWDTSSSLIVNDAVYRLVPDIKTLAAAVVNNNSGHFALANDYDASRDGTYRNAPVRHGFRGKFEGLGHAIDALTIDDTAHTRVGLFNNIYNPGSVRDLRLTHVSVAAAERGAWAGAIAGEVTGEIRNVSVDGSVAVGDYSSAGCVVGSGNYTIHATGACNVHAGARSSAGGLVGGGGASHSIATGTVTGGNGAWVGGLSGGLGAPLSDSYASATVAGGKGSRTGGLAGMLRGGTISRSFATGTVSGSDGANLGGLVGRGYSYGAIENSYAMGAVSGGNNAQAGGLIGHVQNRVTPQTSYSTGNVSAGADSEIGGSIGHDESAETDIYWDTSTSGTETGCGYSPNCAGVTGLTDAQLKSGLPEGFDPNVWGQSPSINNGYPYLLANPPQ